MLGDVTNVIARAYGNAGRSLRQAINDKRKDSPAAMIGSTVSTRSSAANVGIARHLPCSPGTHSKILSWKTSSTLRILRKAGG